MIKLFQYLIIGAFICGFLIVAKAQDPVFSQFYAAPLQLNPAFAGNTVAPFIALNHRRQWPGIDNAYITSAASYDQYFPALNSGIGVSILTDNAGNGIYKKNFASLHYAYRLEVKRDLLIKFGIEAGLLQTRLDWEKLVFYDQLDAYGENPPTQSAENRPSNLNKSLLDVSAGFLVYSPRYYAGFTMKHLNTPNENLLTTNDNLNIGLPLRMALHGGAQFELQKANRVHASTFVSPNIMIAKQGQYWQINSGVYAAYRLFYGGAWYRHAGSNSDAVVALIGFRKGIFKLGYSYDLTISKLSQTNTSGSHEFSLILNFDELDDHKPNYNDCFQIFR